MGILKDVAKKAMYPLLHADKVNEATRDVLFQPEKVKKAVKDPSVKNIAGAALEIGGLAPGIGKAGKAKKAATPLKAAASKAIKVSSDYKKYGEGLSTRKALTPIAHRRFVK